MKQNNKKYKRLLILLAISIIVTLIFVLLNPKNISKLKPTPTPLPIPFALKTVIPNNGVGTQIIETSAIEFRFTQPIDKLSVDIDIKPNIQYGFETDENDRTLFIRAMPWWEIGKKYTITVKAKSVKGEELEKPIVYNLQIEKMKESGLTEIFFPTPSPSPKPK